jgi:exonuclease VII small subunit
MNSKNIPADMENKSIEEAQQEVCDILELLEKEVSLENSLDKYNRLLQLNNHIERRFKDKSKKISQLKIKKTSKSFSKN